MSVGRHVECSRGCSLKGGNENRSVSLENGVRTTVFSLFLVIDGMRY
jgi:hypothetical protein